MTTLALLWRLLPLLPEILRTISQLEALLREEIDLAAKRKRLQTLQDAFQAIREQRDPTALENWLRAGGGDPGKPSGGV